MTVVQDEPAYVNHTGDQEILAKRDAILGAIAWAAEMFLSAPASTWPQTVNQVIARVGESLGVKRIFLLKHQEVTAEYVITGLHYEWVAEGVTAQISREELKRFSMQEVGFGRWAGVLYMSNAVHGFIADLPQGERDWFLSPEAAHIIAVPVFIGEQWWGLIGIEDYVIDRPCSRVELDAFKTVAVTFGAAIRRKRAEEALQLEKRNVEEQAKEIADIARFPAEDPSPVLRVSLSGQVLYANRAAEPVLQFWGTQVGQGVPQTWQETVERVAIRSRSEAVDLVIGEKIFAVLVVPVVEAGYVNLYARDVTRQRQLAQAQSEFISMASHQLRSPLTSVRWYSERLLKQHEHLSADEVEMTEVIHKTAVQLAEIVNDLLSLSRMEQGTVAVTYEEASLGEIMDEVVAELKPQIEQMKQQLEIHYETEVKPFYLDESLVRQVLLNLISNAVKYTPEAGRIQLRIAPEPEDGLRVAVTDTGIGISAADQEKMFSRFFRSKAAVDLRTEGTGLGLSVAKLMVERWGGKIGFDSQEGNGSTFWFTLPVREAKPED